MGLSLGGRWGYKITNWANVIWPTNLLLATTAQDAEAGAVLQDNLEDWRLSKAGELNSPLISHSHTLIILTWNPTAQTRAMSCAMAVESLRNVFNREVCKSVRQGK